MKIIDKYIIKSYLSTSFLSISLFLLISILVQVVRTGDILFASGSQIHQIMMIIILSFPKVFIMLVPLAMLIANVVFFNSKIHSNEITIIKSLGISKLRIMLTVFACSSIGFAICLITATTLAPKSHEKIKILQHQMDENILSSLIKPESFTSKNDITIYVGKTSMDGRIDNIFVRDGRNPHSELILYAKRGSIYFSNQMFVLDANDVLINKTFIDKDNLTSVTHGTFKTLNTQFKILSSGTPSPTRYSVLSMRDLTPHVMRLDLWAIQEFNERIILPLLCVLLPLCSAYCFLTFSVNTRSKNWKQTAKSIAITSYPLISFLAFNNIVMPPSFAIILPYLNILLIFIFLFIPRGLSKKVNFKKNK